MTVGEAEDHAKLLSGTLTVNGVYDALKYCVSCGATVSLFDAGVGNGLMGEFKEYYRTSRWRGQRRMALEGWANIVEGTRNRIDTGNQLVWVIRR